MAGFPVYYAVKSAYYTARLAGNPAIHMRYICFGMTSIMLFFCVDSSYSVCGARAYGVAYGDAQPARSGSVRCLRVTAI